MNHQTNLDRWLTVWMKDGSFVRCDPAGKEPLERAVSRYVGQDTFDERDSLVTLTEIDGSEITTLASFITCWEIVDRVQRERRVAIMLELETEEKEFRRLHTPKPATKRRSRASAR